MRQVGKYTANVELMYRKIPPNSQSNSVLPTECGFQTSAHQSQDRSVEFWTQCGKYVSTGAGTDSRAITGSAYGED